MRAASWPIVCIMSCTAVALPPGTRVFVNEQNANQIWQLDPVTGAIIGQIPTPAEEYMDDMSFANDYQMWVVTKNHDNGKIALIDTDTGEVGLWLNPDRPDKYVMEGLAWNEQHRDLWVSYYNSAGKPDIIQKIDWRFGTVLDQFDAPGYVAQGLVLRDGYLFHSDWAGRAIHKLDPADGHVVDSFTNLPFSPKGMDLCGDKIWVTDPGPNPSVPTSRVWEFDPDGREWHQLWERQFSGRLDGLAIRVPEPHTLVLLAFGSGIIRRSRSGQPAARARRAQT